MFANATPDRNPVTRASGDGTLRYLAEGLNNTEFGFYYMNYHSRLPTVARTHGTMQGLRGASTCSRAHLWM